MGSVGAGFCDQRSHRGDQAANQIVWSWSAAAHINVAEENVNWRDQYPDVFHMNSVEYDGAGGIIVSFRHLDAVYRIDMATGDITWKLGGTPTAQSLTVVGNQYSQLFSGEHYARISSQGTITVQDNGPEPTDAGAELKINTKRMTATIETQVSDPRTIGALCCGQRGTDQERSLGGCMGIQRFHDRVERRRSPAAHHHLSR